MRSLYQTYWKFHVWINLLKIEHLLKYIIKLKSKNYWFLAVRIGSLWGSHFLLDICYYDKEDGFVISSCLALVLANLFMVFHEKNWSRECERADVILYETYVGDITLIVNWESDAENFFFYLNSKPKTFDLLLKRNDIRKFLLWIS